MRASALLAFRRDDPYLVIIGKSLLQLEDALAADSVVVGEKDPHARCDLLSRTRAPAEGLQM